MTCAPRACARAAGAFCRHECARGAARAGVSPAHAFFLRISFPCFVAARWSRRRSRRATRCARSPARSSRRTSCSSRLSCGRCVAARNRSAEAVSRHAEFLRSMLPCRPSASAALPPQLEARNDLIEADLGKLDARARQLLPRIEEKLAIFEQVRARRRLNLRAHAVQRGSCRAPAELSPTSLLSAHPPCSCKRRRRPSPRCRHRAHQAERSVCTRAAPWRSYRDCCCACCCIISYSLTLLALQALPSSLDPSRALPPSLLF